MTKNDGGHAFPSNVRDFNRGMPLRDYFAAAALPYLAARDDIEIKDVNHIARLAYGISDAMLIARGQS